MGNDSRTIDIRVLGAFRVVTADGLDCTPASRKTCALMALIALAPDKRRTRTWLQDRLWGTRGKEQGAASLRQSLAEIRKALGPRQGILVSDKVFVGFEATAVRVDYDTVTFAPGAGTGPEAELLEGLRIEHEDFNDWLAEQRRFMLERRAQAVSVGVQAVPVLAAPAAYGAAARPAAGRLVVTPFAGDVALRPSVDAIVDSIGKTVKELGAAQIVDNRHGLPGMAMAAPPAADAGALVLNAEALGGGVRLTLVDRAAGELIWSTAVEAASLGAPGPLKSDLLQQVNEAASFAIERLVGPQGDAPDHWTAAAHCEEAIRLLFSLGRNNYDMADRLFARAYDLDPRGIYLAWRAYLRTFLIAERQYNCRKTIEEEAFAFLRQAHDREPHNSYVLALGAHVHTILRRSYMSAFEMADRAVRVNPSNPIGWACLGIAKCHLGQSQDGFRDTQLARSIAGWSPTRFQLDALSCIAGSMAGRLDEAIHMGEASHNLAPRFAAPMRYLVALHLIDGNYERSHEIVQKLQLIEPDFSYDRLREKDYPAAGLQRSTFIRKLPSRQF